MFYERFLTLCKAKGMKPTSVADAIGVSRMNASRWKNGTTPSFANIQKLADYFNVPVDYLVNGQTPAHTSPEKVRQLISDAELEGDKIMLDELIKTMEIIPKQYRPAAIHDMTTLAEFVISKYTALAANSNKNQIKQVNTKPGETQKRRAETHP